MKDPKFIELFTSPLVRWGAGAAGGAIGAMMGGFQDAGIGAILGIGAEGIGQSFLQRLYAVPREKLKEALEEAIRNPAIARDLRMKAADARSVSPDTQRWARALLATQPVSAAIRAPEQQPEPEPVQ